jgi:hypothetical protein
MMMLPAVLALICALVGSGQPPAKAPKSLPSAQGQPRTLPTTVVSNGLGLTIQRGTEQGIEVVQAGRSWEIRDGELKIKNEQLVGRTGTVEPSLLINRLEATADTVVVKVDVSPAARSDAFTRALAGADRMKPPTLVDAKGRKYEAIGFVYQDESLTHVRYTKGSPLKGLGEPGVPSLSASTPQRHFTLIFTVSLGVELKEFRVGETVLEAYSPAVKCDQQQR